MIFLYFCKIFIPRSEGPPLTLSQTSPGFYVSCYMFLCVLLYNSLKTMRVNKQFLLFLQRFLPILGAFGLFHKI